VTAPQDLYTQGREVAQGQRAGRGLGNEVVAGIRSNLIADWPKPAQQRLGPSRPDILLWHYTGVLEESAEFAAETLSLQLGGNGEKKADPATDSRAIGRQT